MISAAHTCKMRPAREEEHLKPLVGILFLAESLLKTLAQTIRSIHN